MTYLTCFLVLPRLVLVFVVGLLDSTTVISLMFDFSVLKENFCHKYETHVIRLHKRKGWCGGGGGVRVEARFQTLEIYEVGLH